MTLNYRQGGVSSTTIRELMVVIRILAVLLSTNDGFHACNINNHSMKCLRPWLSRSYNVGAKDVVPVAWEKGTLTLGLCATKAESPTLLPDARFPGFEPRRPWRITEESTLR